MHSFRVCKFSSAARTLFTLYIAGRAMITTKRNYRREEEEKEDQGTDSCAISSLTLLPQNNFSSSETRLMYMGSLMQLLFFSTRDDKNVLRQLCRVCCTWRKKVQRSCFMKTGVCSSGSHETQFSLKVINVMNSGKVHVAPNCSRLNCQKRQKAERIICWVFN